MSAQDDVDEGRRIRLDSRRVEGAKRRAATALGVARHHERAAASERAKADALARTWGFGLDELAGENVDKPGSEG